MNEKRDESRLPDIWVSDGALRFFTDENARSVNVAWIDSHDGIKGTKHYVPYSALESVTRERDAAVRRVRDLEGLLRRAAKYFHEDNATTTGTTRLARLVTEAESLLTKDPS